MDIDDILSLSNIGIKTTAMSKSRSKEIRKELDKSKEKSLKDIYNKLFERDNPKFKFKSGDFVYNIMSHSYGIIIGPYNPYPGANILENSIKENENSGDPRYLMIAFSTDTGELGVRYPKQSYLEFAEEKHKSATSEIPLAETNSDLHEFCHRQCVYDCTPDCIFFKYGLFPKGE